MLEPGGISRAPDSLLPWRVPIDVFNVPETSTAWDAYTFSTAQVNGGSRLSDGTQNAQVGWDLVLAAGTWQFSLIHFKAANRGIYTVALDGVVLGTIDGYNATNLANVVSSIGSIAVATSGKKRLTITMATKNASASSYIGNLNSVQMRRTA